MDITMLSKSIMAMGTVIGLFFGGYTYVDGKYVNKTEFKRLESRVSLNELRRQLRVAQEEAAYYRQLHRKYPEDEEIKQSLDEAEERVKELKAEIKEREKEKRQLK